MLSSLRETYVNGGVNSSHERWTDLADAVVLHWPHTRRLDSRVDDEEEKSLRSTKRNAPIVFVASFFEPEPQSTGAISSALSRCAIPLQGCLFVQAALFSRIARAFASMGTELAPKDPPSGMELATFAGHSLIRTTFSIDDGTGGCFWGLELAFQRVPGVVKTSVGYTQGTVPSPTYELVCSGLSGHTEAVQVESYRRICT